MSDNLPKNPGFASFTVERMTDADHLGYIKITNVAMTGEPIEVIKLVVKSSDAGYKANPTVSASPSPIPAGSKITIATDDLAALTEIGIPVEIPFATDVPSSAFTMTIVGQTADGQETVLQTVNVPAAWA